MKEQKLTKQIKGITLVGLVVTIIVLLIVAGIAINLIFGNNGIFTRAEKAREEYIKAKEEEERKLQNLYSSIKIADNDDTEITIKMKDLQNIIDERINEKISEGVIGMSTNASLVTSKNTDKAISERTFRQFEHTFNKNEFTKYFEYDENSGELTCKESGWYIVKVSIRIGTTVAGSSHATCECFINGNNVIKVCAFGSATTGDPYDSDSLNVYIKEGDKINFKKISAAEEANYINQAIVEIMKN